MSRKAKAAVSWWQNQHTCGEWFSIFLHRIVGCIHEGEDLMLRPENIKKTMFLPQSGSALIAIYINRGIDTSA